jgi:predicted lipoprotein with Yx(FWY)xxD motif
MPAELEVLMRYVPVASALAAGALALAACSSSGHSNSAGGAGGASSSSATGAAGAVIQVHNGVLTNAQGRTLYVTEQEHGAVLCKSSACVSIWIPMTVSAGSTPTGPAQVAGKLTTIKRPDGSMQVALSGKPLYTFSFDHASGQMNGQNQHDSFDGTHFSWHAATVTGTAPAAGSSTASSSSSGGGGYGY